MFLLLTRYHYWLDNIIENDYQQWIFPLKIVIFNSYVKLPEGTYVLIEMHIWGYTSFLVKAI